MLRHRPLLLAAALVAFGQPSQGETWMAKGLDLPRGEAVGVDIMDAAKDGCWTNLGESRTYAEDQLRERGFEIDPISPLRFSLLVHANRNAYGCYGRVSVYLTDLAPTPHISGRARAVVAVGADMVFVDMQAADIGNMLLDSIRTLVHDLDKQTR